MDCAKRSASGRSLDDIPEGPLVEIFSRVPAKSVCVLKCVSKVWLDLITDPRHRKKLPQAMQGLFCQTSKRREAQDIQGNFSFIDLVPRSMPLDIDPSFSFVTEQPGMRFLNISDSCNGLLLFEHHLGSTGNYARLGYIVVNPTTKERKDVPTCGSPSSTSLGYPYLAFDPAVSSHFNLVQFQVERDEKILSVHGYSSETGAWTENQIGEQGDEGQLEGWGRFNFLLANPQSCPFVNGFLHLIVLDQDRMKIVALDVQGKARRMIRVPHVHHRSSWIQYFGESQGQLHYIIQKTLDARRKKYKLSIWVLQDYDAQKWVLKGTVNSHDEVFGEKSGRGGMEEFEVVGIHQHCNVIFFTRSLGHKLMAYNMDCKELSTIATFDDQEWVVATARFVPCF